MKRTLIIALSVVALVFGVISYASAETDATTVSATVGTLLEITAPETASLGTIKPDVPATTNVLVEGKSNRPATMSASVGTVGGVGEFTTLKSTTAAAVTGLRGGNIKVNYTVEGMVNYNVDPGDVSGTVTYSLVQ